MELEPTSCSHRPSQSSWGCVILQQVREVRKHKQTFSVGATTVDSFLFSFLLAFLAGGFLARGFLVVGFLEDCRLRLATGVVPCFALSLA